MTLVILIPVIAELTIRCVAHFNFLHTSKLPIYTNYWHISFQTEEVRGILPRAEPIDSTVLSSKARNFSRISSHASEDNFRKRTLPAISSASHPFCSSRRSYRCSRIDDPICRYHIVRLFDFLGNNKQSTESIIRSLQLVELFGFRIIVLYTYARDSSFRSARFVCVKTSRIPLSPIFCCQPETFLPGQKCICIATRR